MNLYSGVIDEIYVDRGLPRAKVRVRSAVVHVPLFLLMNPRIGDRVLIEAGVAIAKVSENQPEDV